uniref:Hypothetical secreted peptide n=1 Tax=Glossina morsitans morsitans TaxID=37546 RepID=D3TST1_GLOMM
MNLVSGFLLPLLLLLLLLLTTFRSGTLVSYFVFDLYFLLQALPHFCCTMCVYLCSHIYKTKH